MRITITIDDQDLHNEAMNLEGVNARLRASEHNRESVAMAESLSKEPSNFAAPKPIRRARRKTRRK